MNFREGIQYGICLVLTSSLVTDRKMLTTEGHTKFGVWRKMKSESSQESVSTEGNSKL